MVHHEVTTKETPGDLWFLQEGREKGVGRVGRVGGGGGGGLNTPFTMLNVLAACMVAPSPWQFLLAQRIENRPRYWQEYVEKYENALLFFFFTATACSMHNYHNYFT